METRLSAEHQQTQLSWIAIALMAFWLVSIGVISLEAWNVGAATPFLRTIGSQRLWIAILYAVIMLPITAAVSRAIWKTAEEQRKIFWITVLYVVILLFIMGMITIGLWGRPNFIIAYVPVYILEWSFIGGMVGVMYRLAYRRNTPDIRFYTWIVAKPIIGLIMGALIYFLAVGGGQLLGAPPLNDPNANQPNNQIMWLNALAFIGGFSDRFSIELINRIISGTKAEKGDKTKEDQE
jgi:hypothetical protein